MHEMCGGDSVHIQTRQKDTYEMSWSNAREDIPRAILKCKLTIFTKQRRIIYNRGSNVLGAGLLMTMVKGINRRYRCNELKARAKSKTAKLDGFLANSKLRARASFCLDNKMKEPYFVEPNPSHFVPLLRCVG